MSSGLYTLQYKSALMLFRNCILQA